jgi:hypothetical protein
MTVFIDEFPLVSSGAVKIYSIPRLIAITSLPFGVFFGFALQYALLTPFAKV